MSDIFAVRKVDDKTKEFIHEYAHEHDLKLGEALREIACLVKEHLKEKERNKQKKKYKNLFDGYEKIAFNSGDPNLSKHIDKILYGKRD